MKNLIAGFAIIVVAVLMTSIFAVKSFSTEKEMQKQIDKIHQSSEKEIQEKNKEIEDVKKEFQQKEELVLQDRRRTAEENKRMKENLKKIHRITIEKLKEQKSEFERKYRSFIAGQKTYTAKQLDHFKKEIEKARKQSKQIKQALSQAEKKNVEIHLFGKKHKLPSESAELIQLIEKKKKLAQEELENAKQRYASLLQQQKSRPNDKNLEKEIQSTKQEIQNKEKDLDELVALGTAAYFLGGPLAAGILIFMMALDGFGKGKSGSGTMSGASTTGPIENQSRNTKRRSNPKGPSPDEKKGPIGPLSGMVHSKQSTKKFLQIKGRKLFLNKTRLGIASKEVRDAVGNGKMIVKRLSQGKFLIHHRAHACKEVFKEGAYWRLGGEQHCPRQAARR